MMKNVLLAAKSTNPVTILFARALHITCDTKYVSVLFAVDHWHGEKSWLLVKNLTKPP